jgi:hypothetical protein
MSIYTKKLSDKLTYRNPNKDDYLLTLKDNQAYKTALADVLDYILENADTSFDNIDKISFFRDFYSKNIFSETFFVVDIKTDIDKFNYFDEVRSDGRLESLPEDLYENTKINLIIRNNTTSSDYYISYLLTKQGKKIYLNATKNREDSFIRPSWVEKQTSFILKNELRAYLDPEINTFSSIVCVSPFLEAPEGFYGANKVDSYILGVKENSNIIEGIIRNLKISGVDNPISYGYLTNVNADLGTTALAGFETIGSTSINNLNSFDDYNLVNKFSVRTFYKYDPDFSNDLDFISEQIGKIEAFPLVDAQNTSINTRNFLVVNIYDTTERRAKDYPVLVENLRDQYGIDLPDYFSVKNDITSFLNDSSNVSPLALSVARPATKYDISYRKSALIDFGYSLVSRPEVEIEPYNLVLTTGYKEILVNNFSSPDEQWFSLPNQQKSPVVPYPNNFFSLSNDTYQTISSIGVDNTTGGKIIVEVDYLDKYSGSSFKLKLPEFDLPTESTSKFKDLKVTNVVSTGNSISLGVRNEMDNKPCFYGIYMKLLTN